MSDQTITGVNRDEATFPVEDDAIFYLANPNDDPDPEAPTHTDNWLKMQTLRQSLEGVVEVVAFADSPYTVPDGFIRRMVDTRAGQVAVVLPAAPVVGVTRVRLLPLTDSYETNSLIVQRNGNLIGGVDEDVEVDVNNFAFDLLFAGGDIGWVVVPNGKSVHLQHVKMSSQFAVDVREDSATNVVIASDDVNSMVKTLSATQGTIDLGDPATWGAHGQMQVYQQGAGQMDFMSSTQGVVIESLDDMTTTAGVGALVFVYRDSATKFIIAGGLV